MIRALALFACLAAPAAADVILPVDATRLRVIDGDSVGLAMVEIDLGPVDLQLDELGVRLIGYDTPETHRPRCAWEDAQGERATAMLEAMIATGAPIALHVVDELDRHGRLLARMTIGGYDAGRMLILAELARPYDGGARRPWCR